jgi:long-chain acyl-CoA synthetase
MKKEFERYEENGRKIIKGLGYYDTHEIKDIRELVRSAREKFGDKVAFKYKKDGEIIKKTYIDFENDVNCLGTALNALGLKDEKVAVISENRYEWGVAYLSVLNGLGIGVPFDKYLPKVEIENLTVRSKIKAIFYSEQFLEMMQSIAKENEYIKYYICLDDIKVEQEGFYTINELIQDGHKRIQNGDNNYINLPIDREKMSILLFTSGTTTMSKGVMLSHKNIVSNISSIESLIKIEDNDVHLSLLPLHHTFENTIGFLFMLYSGVCIAYCEGIKHIAQNLSEFGVTILVAVPAIYEAMYDKVQEGIKKAGKEKAVKILSKISEALLKIKIDIRKTVFKSIREKVGPYLRLMASGAAPIDKEIIKLYESLGITFLQGFGLTETSPLVCATSPIKNMYGTVGYPVKGVELSIDSPDENGIGELIVKGNNVMIGYYEAREETLEAFTSDGWFKTGDLAKFSKDDVLTITGRVKSMIVFTNGKKAFPEEYETLLNTTEGIKESFVWGNKADDGDIQICAKIVLDEDQDVESAIEKIDKEIKKINENIPKYKIIRYFVVTKEELIKTTTLKVKRKPEQEKIEKYLKENNTNMRKMNKKVM